MSLQSPLHHCCPARNKPTTPCGSAGRQSRKAEGCDRGISNPRRHRPHLGDPSPPPRQKWIIEGVDERRRRGDIERPRSWSKVCGLYARFGEKWAAGDKEARKEVEAALAKAGLTIDEVTAKTLEKKLDFFQRLDRMLASAEARRNNALREIDRHRDALGGASVDRSRRSRMRSSETSRLARLPQGQKPDQRKATARQSGQRKGEQGTADQNRKGSLSSKRVAPWLKHSCFQRAFTLNPGRGDRPQACRP